MKKAKIATLTCCALAALGSSIAAQAEDGKWTLGVAGGTLGIGPEIAYRYNERFGMRLNGGFYSHDQDEELDDIEYNGEIDLNSIGLQADWYPFGGGFRLSLGARSNNNEIKLDGRPTGTVQIGNTNYNASDVGILTGTVTTDSFAPTLALGYGGTLAKGFTLGFEAGVMVQGSPKIENLRASGPLSSNQAFLNQLAIEQARVEEDAEDFEYWPVIQVSFLYRF